jgi:hypothetical protein
MTDSTPSPGACATSLIHVLDKTKDSLHPALREHLEGVLTYVTAQEVARPQPQAEPVSSPMAAAWLALAQWLAIEVGRYNRLRREADRFDDKNFFDAFATAYLNVKNMMATYDLVVDDTPSEPEKPKSTWPDDCPSCHADWRYKSRTMGRANGQPHHGICTNGHSWFEGAAR